MSQTTRTQHTLEKYTRSTLEKYTRNTLEKYTRHRHSKINCMCRAVHTKSDRRQTMENAEDILANMFGREQKYAARNLMSQISYLQLWEMVRQTHSRSTSCW